MEFLLVVLFSFSVGVGISMKLARHVRDTLKKEQSKWAAKAGIMTFLLCIGLTCAAIFILLSLVFSR